MTSLIMIITESPDRIKVTPRWSSTNIPQEYSHQMYSSLLIHINLLFSSTYFLFYNCYLHASMTYQSILFYVVLNSYFYLYILYASCTNNSTPNLCLLFVHTALLILLSRTAWTWIITSNLLAHYNCTRLLLF